ncbi:MAG: HDIG domain-containing protein [Clostridia bacterium]|nr:HDIG domain-containing protein [Clostridia bacterium]
MKEFRQHYDTSCFEHCKNVAFISYKICKKLNLDYKSAARAGMLHDLFLYDWRKRQDGRKGLHAFTHPRTALENSKKIFELNEKEEDIILKHMWPLTVKLPKYSESYIVTIADKYCALGESCGHYLETIFSKKILKFAYVFITLFLIRL